MASYYCEKCGRTLEATDFYTSNNLEKYPNEGKLRQCRRCITMHVDPYDPDTFLWLIKEVDVPWVPNSWNEVILREQQKGNDITGLSIFGRYMAKMRLKQFLKYRWKDTEALQQATNAKIQETMERQGYDQTEIDKVLTTGVLPDAQPPEDYVKPGTPASRNSVVRPQETEDYFAEQSGPEPEIDLTDEERMALRLKWGKTYRPEEWVRLEQLYQEMTQSYDIQTAGHIDTLKLICKTSLKANQLIDIGDIEGYQKVSRVYDSLMKSGNFTAAQNKQEQSEFIDAISELVSLCEEEGFIPRYYVEGPQDKVDECLRDFKVYVNNLVNSEQNLGALIENAVKEIEQQESKHDDLETEVDNADEIVEDLDYDTISQLKDQDFSDYSAFLDQEMEDDEMAIKRFSEGVQS